MSPAEKRPDSLSLADAVWNRAANVRRWSAFSALTALYGTVSIVGGPVTPKRAASKWAMQHWSRGSLKSLDIHVDLVGADRYDPERPCIYIANHLSVLDILVVGAVVESDYRWMAKAPLFWVPFIGWHLYLAGHIPVYRGKKRVLNRDLPKRIAKVVEGGGSLFFFPEGTRSLDGHLKSFKIGAFKAAIEHDLPIVPLVIEGTANIMQKGTRGLSTARRECQVTVLPTVEVPADRSDERAAAEALRDLVHAQYAAHLG